MSCGKTKIIIGVLMLSFLLVAAFPASSAEGEVTVGYVEWDCAISQSHILAAALEEHFDMDVELISVEAGVMWTSLSEGDLDAVVCAWLPATHGFYWDTYGHDVLDVGANFTGARIGLVVPEYVDIDSITELNDHKDQFDNMIYGIDPGAGIMAATDEAIELYELDMNLLDASDAAMTAQLQSSVENEEWIVVTGWVPHWKFDVYNLKFLDDPLGVYGEAENIHTVLRKGFLGEFDEEVAEFLIKFDLTHEELHEMMNRVREEPHSEIEIARKWIMENPEALNRWIGVE